MEAKLQKNVQMEQPPLAMGAHTNAKTEHGLRRTVAQERVAVGVVVALEEQAEQVVDLVEQTVMWLVMENPEFLI